MRNELLVSVQMITYGHEAYIQQAIESVLIQETDFEFELIIADDCSLDKTHEIINEIIKTNPKSYRIKYFRHKENMGMQKNGIFALSKCMGKYIAICEGDDYWIDPLKLQNQVDFLEKNEDYGLIYTDASIYNQETNTFEKPFSSYYKDTPNSDNYFHHLLLRNCIQTLTVLTRKKYIWEAFESISDIFYSLKIGDYPLWLEIAHNTKIKYLNDITAVYRKSSNSSASYNNLEKRYDFLQSSFDIQFYFCKKYNLNEINKEVQVLYSRFLCNRAFDLNLKDIDKNILLSFEPNSIRDILIKFSLKNSIINVSVRFLIKIVSFYKFLVKSISQHVNR